MTTLEILRRRLHNTGLIGSAFTDVKTLVEHLGAVQSQDYTAAKWSLGQRLTGSTEADIETAFNEGRILRTHVLRPTWHFVTPENIRWMLELTAPRVKAFMGHYNRKLELDDKLFKKTNAVIVKTLEHNSFLTRQELKAHLTEAGIITDVQRLGHIIMQAELDALICSGPYVVSSLPTHYWKNERLGLNRCRVTKHYLNWPKYILEVTDQLS